jgi:hypothetical protein
MLSLGGGITVKHKERSQNLRAEIGLGKLGHKQEDQQQNPRTSLAGNDGGLCEICLSALPYLTHFDPLSRLI